MRGAASPAAGRNRAESSRARYEDLQHDSLRSQTRQVVGSVELPREPRGPRGDPAVDDDGRAFEEPRERAQHLGPRWIGLNHDDVSTPRPHVVGVRLTQRLGEDRSRDNDGNGR